MYQMFATADGPSRTALGMAQARIAGGEITVMAQDPTGGYWSRAIGLGIDEPLTGDVLDRSISFARDNGATSVVFQIAPAVDGDWERLLRQRGVTPSGTWVKFAGPTASARSPARRHCRSTVAGAPRAR